MKYWKIGSRWHDNGAKSNSILDVFLQNSIVFVKEKNTGGRMMNDVKIGLRCGSPWIAHQAC